MPTVKQIKRAQRQLAENGFGSGLVADGMWGPKSKAAVKMFKRAYAGAVPGIRSLVMRSGRLTRRTRRCLDALPYLSPHFTVGELKSKGNGDCYVHRRLLRALEKMRRKYGPVHGLSGYRDPYHNDVTVKGAKSSQHKYGTAFDPTSPFLTVPQVRSLGVFSGIGYDGATGRVRHVDVRHAGPNNTTGGTPKNPTIWRY